MHRITMTRPADFVGATAAVVGFEPIESFVALSFSRGGFHARVDLPHTNDHLMTVATKFGAAFRRNPGQRVVLLCFTDHVQHALDVVTAVTAISDGLADVILALRIDGNDVYDVPTGRLVDHITPEMRDAYAAEMVGDGRAASHASREARREALFAPQPQPPAEAIEASAHALTTVSDDARLLAEEVRWVAETVRIHALTGLRVADDDAARLIVDAGHPTLMDAVLAQIDRDNAEGHAALWTDLTNRAPDQHITGPALVAAFAQWQVGDGAAAWMAHDKANAPKHPLASFIATALDEAIHPSTWHNRPEALRLRKQYRPDA